MRVFRSLLLLVGLAPLALVEFACSSSDSAATPGPVAAEAGPEAAVLPSFDAAVADASAEAASLAPITGTLDVHAVGAFATTVKIGAFTPKSGNAQWRARPSGGGVLTVRLNENAAVDPSRSLELSFYDDAGTLDANEEFTCDAPSSVMLHRVRVETYQGAAGWRTGGDGTATIVSFGTTSVTLKLTKVGQFTQDGAGTDVFVVDGTVTVPLSTFAPTTGGAANVAISNLGNEPIGGDAPNVASPTQTLTSSAAGLNDLAYPFTSKRRAAAFTSEAAGVTRNLRIAFPSGHLPRLGRSVDLSKFDRAVVTYFEGSTLSEAMTEKTWEASKGTLVVDTLSASSMTLHLQSAGMQSESPTARGTFDLDGTVTIPLPATP